MYIISLITHVGVLLHSEQRLYLKLNKPSTAVNYRVYETRFKPFLKHLRSLRAMAVKYMFDYAVAV